MEQTEEEIQELLLICLGTKKFLQAEYLKTQEQLKKLREENNG